MMSSSVKKKIPLRITWFLCRKDEKENMEVILSCVFLVFIKGEEQKSI